MKIGLVPMSAKPYHAGHHMLVEFAAISEIVEELEELELPINDAVAVFVSFTGRGVRKIKDPSDSRTLKQGARKIEMPKPGQVPVFGSDMKHIWNNILKPNLNLPDKARIITPDDGANVVPIKNVHEVCGALKEAYDSGLDVFEVPYLGVSSPVEETVINIYSDDQDIVSNYSDELMFRLYGDLWKNKSTPAIRGIGVPRSATVEISGTQMREYLCAGDIESFSSLLPPLPEDSKIELGEILSTSIQCGLPLGRRPKKELEEALLRNYISTILRG